MITPALAPHFQYLSAFAHKRNFQSVMDFSEQQTGILQLPRDSLSKIVRYLDYGTLEKATAVCRSICLEILEMMHNLQKHAVENDLNGQYMIAHIYLSSKMPEIQKIGFSWMRFSADILIKTGDLKNLELHDKLSDFFLNGHSDHTNTPDTKRAFDLAQAGAGQRHPRAQYNLAVCYAKGLGVPQNEAESVRLYRLAADQGYTRAQYMLAIFYTYGISVAKDAGKAARFWRLAAEQGDASAQYNLGSCYANGQGVVKDEAEAARFWRLAAEQGDASAQNNLGSCYANGQGVVKDEAEGVRFWRLAAEQGHIEAQYNLGICYANGQGVVKDEAEAARFWRLAAEQGDASAQNNLGAYYADGQGVVKNDR